MRGIAETTRLPNWLLGLILVILISIGGLLGYTKRLPWTHNFTVHAVFSSPQTIRTTTPVRIAGVEVGEVREVELLGEPIPNEIGEVQPAVRVTMEIKDNALPLAEDTTFTVRPRLFLDGNYFVDVSPGSPSAEKVDDGHTFGLEQTAHSVQLDEILTTLQSDVRTDLKTLLDQFGNALIRHKGAEGLQDLYRRAPRAYRYTAQVAESQLGTERGDLRGVIRGLGKVLGGLSRDEQALSDLVTNLRVVTGSFAAEDAALSRAIKVLPEFLAEGEPTFQAINEALPPLRAFAREALPGVRTSPETLRAGLPLLEQLRGLVSRSELRGLVSRLRPTVPELAGLAKGNFELFEQQRAFSSCFNEVIIPWSNSPVVPVDPQGVYPLEVSGRTFESTGYSLAGAASESRSGDANGQHLRVLGGGGTNLVKFPASAGRDEVFGLTPFPILGAMPRVDDSAKSAYRPEEPCEQQEPPNLEGGIAAPPEQEPAPTAAGGGLDALSGPAADRLREIVEMMDNLDRVNEIRAAGDDRAADQIIERTQELVDKLGFPEIDVAAAVEAAG